MNKLNLLQLVSLFGCLFRHIMLARLLTKILVKEKLGKYNTVINYACFHVQAPRNIRYMQYVARYLCRCMPFNLCAFLPLLIL